MGVAKKTKKYLVLFIQGHIFVYNYIDYRYVHVNKDRAMSVLLTTMNKRPGFIYILNTFSYRGRRRRHLAVKTQLLFTE